MLLRKDNGVYPDLQKSQKRFCLETRTGKGQPESKEKANKEKADTHSAFTETLSVTCSPSLFLEIQRKDRGQKDRGNSIRNEAKVEVNRKIHPEIIHFCCLGQYIIL